LTILSSTITE